MISMSKYLAQFIVKPEYTIMDALKRIDKNAKGFVIIVDEIGKAVGLLTDGDIRRAFIAGNSIEENVLGVARKTFKYLTTMNTVADATELFKNDTIKFLPVLDEKGILKNVITKQQMHSVLLLDIHADLLYDFGNLDDNIINHEIFQRPWGFYKTTVMNAYFQSKVISVKPGGQLSLQSHNHREEHWIVAHGVGTVQLDQTIMEIHCGNSIFIPKGCKHRLSNTDEKESLIITEVQIGDYFGEDDIIRYEDVYGRV